MDPHAIPTVEGESHQDKLANIEAMVANLNERKAQIQREERERAEEAERQAKLLEERQKVEAEAKAKQAIQEQKLQEASNMLGRPVVYKACPPLPHEETPQQKLKRLSAVAQRAKEELDRALAEARRGRFGGTVDPAEL